MPRFEVTSDRLPYPRGQVVDLDPAVVNVPALIAAGHIRPSAAPTTRRTGGNSRSR